MDFFTVSEQFFVCSIWSYSTIKGTAKISCAVITVNPMVFFDVLTQVILPTVRLVTSGTSMPLYLYTTLQLTGADLGFIKGGANSRY